MLKALLIQPYITSSNPIGLTEPIGLMSLASYVEKVLAHTVDIKILDLFAERYDQWRQHDTFLRMGLDDRESIIGKVKAFSPSIIGISCNFTAFEMDAVEIAKMLKETFPETVILFGGVHATAEAENIIRKYHFVDYIVRGEGELTFTELLRSYSQGGNLREIAGLTFRDSDGRVVQNQDRELIDDLDALPIPDRKFIDFEKYKKIHKDKFKFARNNPVGTIISSRGCPYKCVFCSTGKTWNRKWRARSPMATVAEIEYLVNSFGVREISILDDQFMFDVERAHAICDLIIRKNLKITIFNASGSSVWLLDEHLLRKLKETGFYRLELPIESGCERTLQFIKKPVKLDQTLKIISLANRLGFWTQGMFIIGFPYETKEEIRETIDFAFTCGLDFPMFFIAKAYAGSELSEVLIHEKIMDSIDSIPRASSLFRADFPTKHLTVGDLNEIYEKTVRSVLKRKIFHYLDPLNFYRSLMPKITNLSDLKYAMKIFFTIWALRQNKV